MTARRHTEVTIAGARVVTPDGVLDPGWVRLAGDRIAAVGTGTPPSPATRDLGGAWLLPGFVDIHVHGGGGHDMAASLEDMAAAVAYHHSTGTAATLVSLVTAPLDDLCERLDWVATLAERGPTPDGHVLGAHLEGPFLSRPRCGAQNPDHLLLPDRGALAKLIDAGRGHLRSVTLAPELPGALELIDDLVEAGIVAAVGHTDATYGEAGAAFARGARLATHLFNGMRPMHHREPGPVLAALDSDARCEIINDGIHVHSAVPKAVHSRGEGRLVLITDAIDATGVGNGRYRLGGQDVVVSDGEARLAATGNLAGSTLTMACAVRHTVVETGLSVQAAAEAAATNPARVLGLAGQRGAISPGLIADLTILDDDYRVCGVVTAGEWRAAS